MQNKLALVYCHVLCCQRRSAKAGWFLQKDAPYTPHECPRSGPAFPLHRKLSKCKSITKRNGLFKARLKEGLGMNCTLSDRTGAKLRKTYPFALEK